MPKHGNPTVRTTAALTIDCTHQNQADDQVIMRRNNSNMNATIACNVSNRRNSFELNADIRGLRGCPDRSRGVEEVRCVDGRRSGNRER